MRTSEPGDPARAAFLDAYATSLVARGGELVDARSLPGLVVVAGDDVVGALSYLASAASWEVVTLHVAVPWGGVGTALLDGLARRAAASGAARVVLTTTNDNLDALRFYQRRGFRIVRVLPGAVNDARRRLKPSIPELGEYGIPIRDEVVLERLL